MNWHERYLLQAGWTCELRTYLFRKAGIQNAQGVLEVGCGTGAVLSEVPTLDQSLSTQTKLYGLDISTAALAECQGHKPGALLTCGDALDLPYPNKMFDIVYCHFLLLWVKDPLGALREMKRVTMTQGHILALAEPDYTARIDRPKEISSLGKWQSESLIKQGADIALGSRLADLFYQAGINIREAEMIKNRRNVTISMDEWENEWDVLMADLAGSIPEEELQRIKNLDEQAWRRGEHEMTVPTYFAWGQV